MRGPLTGGPLKIPMRYGPAGGLLPEPRRLAPVPFGLGPLGLGCGPRLGQRLIR